MIDYSNIGKGGIVKEGIFVRFPDLRPACPDNWGLSELHWKLMIVGESNYLPNNADSVFKDPMAWYQGEDIQHLIPNGPPEDPDEWRKKFQNHKSGYLPFDRLYNSMKNVLKTDFDHLYDEAIYYNYFLRPATDGVSFRKFCKGIDQKVAGIALCGILEIVKPDIVIFASKYAYDEFTKYIKSTKYNNVRIEFVYHPSSKFQKWESNPKCKQKFEELLRKYWIK